jgi:hypothetical protein
MLQSRHSAAVRITKPYRVSNLGRLLGVTSLREPLCVAKIYRVFVPHRIDKIGDYVKNLITLALTVLLVIDLRAQDAASTPRSYRSRR